MLTNKLRIQQCPSPIWCVDSIWAWRYSIWFYLPTQYRDYAVLDLVRVVWFLPSDLMPRTWIPSPYFQCQLRVINTMGTRFKEYNVYYGRQTILKGTLYRANHWHDIPFCKDHHPYIDVEVLVVSNLNPSQSRTTKKATMHIRNLNAWGTLLKVHRTQWETIIFGIP